MEPVLLDRRRLHRLIEAACEQLDGDWVLLGGAVAALCFSPDRVTEDIDLVALGGPDSRRYELMDFALGQGLPIEAVNSAADFFLRREGNITADLELLHAGSRGRVLRPSPTLFLLLKCGRMSESDLDDCLAQLGQVRSEGGAIDAPRVLARLVAAASMGDGTQAEARRRRLGAELEVVRRASQAT
jgi:hypothetical protein